MGYCKLPGKRGLAILLALVMCLSFLPAPAALAAEADENSSAGFSGGTGSEDNPYLISSAEDLIYLSQVINSDNTSDYQRKYFALTADIDLGGAEWTPIGKDPDHYFWGTFYGGGHTISNFRCTGTIAGLFGYILYTKLYNLTISNATVTASGQHCAAGTLAAVDFYKGTGGSPYSYFTELHNCHVVNSEVQANGTYIRNTPQNKPCAGGLVGTASKDLRIHYCTVKNCSISSNYNAGGVLGSAAVENCNIRIGNTACIDGNVSSTNTTRNTAGAGGILGSAEVKCVPLQLRCCLNTAEITVSDTPQSYAGGLMGYFSTSTNALIWYCLNTGVISKDSDAFVGYPSSFNSKLREKKCFTNAKEAEETLLSTTNPEEGWTLIGNNLVPKGCPGGDHPGDPRGCHAYQSSDSVFTGCCKSFHLVTFDLRDGSPLIRQSVQSNTVIPTAIPADKIPATASHETGDYTFSKWVYITDTVQWQPGGENLCISAEYAAWDMSNDTVTSDMVLYADWNHQSGATVYYAKFETPGESDPVIPSQRFIDPRTVIKPIAPAKYADLNWYYVLYDPAYSGGELDYQNFTPHRYGWEFENLSEYAWKQIRKNSFALDRDNVIRLYPVETAKDPMPIIPPPAPTISKAVDKTEVKVGEEMVYTITVTNRDEDDAIEVTVQDTLPAKVELSDPGTGSYDPDTRTITWSSQTVSANSYLELTFKVKAAAAGRIENTAQLTSPVSATSNTVTTTVTEPVLQRYTVIYRESAGETVYAEFPGLLAGGITPACDPVPTREGYTLTWRLTTGKGQGIDGVKEHISADDADDQNQIIYEAVWTKIPDAGTGDLTISKTVKGDGDDPVGTFDFTITLTLPPEPETPSPEETPAAPEQSAPSEDNNSVQQDPVNSAGPEDSEGPKPDDARGEDLEEGPAQTEQVSVVSNSSGAETKEFAYTGNGVMDGRILFSKTADRTWTGTVRLSHRQSITLQLPTGTEYAVREEPAEDYEVTASGDAGTIAEKQAVTASFINTKKQPPEEPKEYTVIHRYYYNNTVLESEQAETKSGNVGDTIYLDDLLRPNGYTFTSASLGSGPWNLVDGWSIILNYNRAPEPEPDIPWEWPDPDPEPEPTPTPTPDPEPEPEPTPEPEPEPVTPPLQPGISDRPVDPFTGMVPYDPAVILDDLVPLAAPHLNITDHYAYAVGYANGLIRPEGDITRAEAATIFFRLMQDDYRLENWATENDFTDVNAGDWYNNAISTCAKAGIIKGYEDGYFRPNATITRAEFAAIAARFVSDDVPGYDYFTDMDGHWAQADVARAVMAGWIKGEGRLFRPEDQLTRAETATMVNRMINRFPDKEHLLQEMIVWPDNPKDKWYYEDIQEATNSHDYEQVEFEFTEIWTILLANRDWAALEKEWADAAAAPGGEVAPDLRPGDSGSEDEPQDITDILGDIFG